MCSQLCIANLLLGQSLSAHQKTLSRSSCSHTVILLWLHSPLSIEDD